MSEPLEIFTVVMMVCFAVMAIIATVGVLTCALCCKEPEIDETHADPETCAP
jgi:hypothetical protein